MENCASSFALLQKEKECLKADSCPSTTGSSIFLLPCAITWTIFSQGLLARAFTYALLPSASSTVLLYQSSVGFPPFFRTSHQSQTMNQLGTTYLSETLQKREDFFFLYKTRPGVLDHGRRLPDCFLGYYTWRNLAHNEGSTKSAGSPSLILFFFSHSFFTSPL